MSGSTKRALGLGALLGILLMLATAATTWVNPTFTAFGTNLVAAADAAAARTLIGITSGSLAPGDFNPTQFGVASGLVSITNTASLTNITIRSGLTMPDISGAVPRVLFMSTAGLFTTDSAFYYDSALDILRLSTLRVDVITNVSNDLRISVDSGRLIRFQSGSAVGVIGGTTFASATTTANGAAANTTLYTNTIPGLALTAAGDRFYFEASGQILPTIQTDERVRVNLGSTTIMDTSSMIALFPTLTNGSNWKLRGTITYVSASVQLVDIQMSAIRISASTDPRFEYNTSLTAAENSATDLGFGISAICTTASVTINNCFGEFKKGQ